MPELSSTSSPEGFPPLAYAESAVPFLRVQATHMDMIANYEELLDAMIFSQQPLGCDGKLSKKYRRVLATLDSYKVLNIIWKESEFMNDALACAGLRRMYEQNQLTAHRLAADLARNGTEVAKLNSRIRTIGMAAAAYQLLDRDLVHSTKVILKGTHLLNGFMSDLSAKYILAMTRFVSLSEAILPPASSSGC